MPDAQKIRFCGARGFLRWAFYNRDTGASDEVIVRRGMAAWGAYHHYVITQANFTKNRRSPARRRPTLSRATGNEMMGNEGPSE